MTLCNGYTWPNLTWLLCMYLRASQTAIASSSYQPCAKRELPLSLLPNLKNKSARMMISREIHGDAVLEALTEWRHCQRYECEQGAGPLIAQFLGFPVSHRSFETTKQMRGFALTVVHLNTKQANMLIISECGYISVELVLPTGMPLQKRTVRTSWQLRQKLHRAGLHTSLSTIRSIAGSGSGGQLTALN